MPTQASLFITEEAYSYAVVLSKRNYRNNVLLNIAYHFRTELNQTWSNEETYNSMNTSEPGCSLHLEVSHSHFLSLKVRINPWY